MHTVNSTNAHRTATRWIPVIATASIVIMIAGCGRRDLGRVNGHVVSNGAPRGFGTPESMSLMFKSSDGKLPMLYMAPVMPDGTFAVDMNDGRKTGIPKGTYSVFINVEDLQMRMPDAPPVDEDDPAYRYPRPSKEVKQRLAKAGCTVQLAPGKTVTLLVDIDAGTITETQPK